jgi:pimeloyl-ACP methyl ester carboxylesterase
MKSMHFQGLIAAILLVGVMQPATAAVREETIPGRPGIVSRALVVTPDPATFQGPPRAAAILYVGGNGDLSAMKNNFLQRIRQRLADGGLLLVIPDAPSDRAGKTNLQGNFRAGHDHAEDARGLVRFIKAQGNFPVFAIGTSRGSTSAANAAARLGPDIIAGTALTASVTHEGSRGQISIYQTAVKDIRQPALVMWHEADACSETPPADAPKLAAALTSSAQVTVKTLAGGAAPRSGPCAALSPHGFLGIEDQAADIILAWIDELLAAR